MGAAAHVGGWFLAPPPSLVKFRAWVCKTAGPLECEKNSRIRILRFQRRARPSVLFPARRPQQAPGAARETAGTSAAGAVTFNARRDYELLEQVVSTYGR